MDWKLFRDNESHWSPQAYSTPRVVGMLFQTYVHMWIKNYRIYRPNTAMYGKIEFEVWSRTALDPVTKIPNVPVPNTYIAHTFTAGTGPTGWVNVPLPQPIKLPYSGATYKLVVRFPGGANNVFAYSRVTPQYYNPPKYDVWTEADLDGFVWGHEYIPFQSTQVHQTRSGYKNPILATAPYNAVWGDQHTDMRQETYVNGNYGLHWVVGPLPTGDKIWRSHGLDVFLTDHDPYELLQAGPVYKLWNNSGPPYQVTVADYKLSAITGMDIDVTKTCFVTHLRVYRHKGFVGADEEAVYATNDRNHNLDANGNRTADSGLPAKVVRPEAPYILTQEMYNGGVVGCLYEIHANGTYTYVPGSRVEFYNLHSIFSQSYVGWVGARLDGPVRIEEGKRYRIVISWNWSRPSTANWYTASGPGAQPRAVGPITAVGRSNGHSSTGAFIHKPGSLPDEPKKLLCPTTPTTEQVWSDVQVTTKDPYLSESGGGYGDDREPNAVAQRMWWAWVPPDGIETRPGEKLCIQEFQVTAPAKAYGVRFFRPDSNLWGNVVGGLFIRTPLTIAPYFEVLGTGVTFKNLNSQDSPQQARGWKYEPFTAPVRLAPGQTYVIAMYFPNGFPIVDNYFLNEDVDGRTSGVLEIPVPGRSYLPRTDNHFLDVTIVPWAGTQTGAAGTGTLPLDAIRAWAEMDMDEVQPAVLPSITQSMRWSSGMEFSVDTDATGHGMHFYRPSELLGGEPTARLYTIQENSGAYYTEVVGADVTFTLSGTGWQYAAFRQPILLKSSKRYFMAFYWPDGMPTTKVDYYNIYEPSGNVDWLSGNLLRFPTHGNAHMGRQSLLGLPSQLGDNVSYMGTTTNWHMLLDISVTRGTEGASSLGQERDDALSLMGSAPPSQTVYVQSNTWNIPGGVVGHEIRFDEDVTIHGIRWFRYTLVADPVDVVIYRVSDRFPVGHSRQFVPPPTMYGWVYIPFDEPVPVSATERYRVTMYCRDAFQTGPQQFTSTRTSGVLTAMSSWTLIGPREYPILELEYPRFVDNTDFYLDVSYTVGTEYSPAVHRTLFADDEPENNVIVSEPRGGLNIGMRFSTAKMLYATAIRFWRSRIAVGSGGAVLAGLWVGDAATALLPNSQVMFRIISNPPNPDMEWPYPDTGWQVQALPYPVPLYPHGAYTVSAFMPNYAGWTEDYFKPGHRGDTGTRALFSANSNGTLYWGGGAAYRDGIQGVYKNSHVFEFPNQGLELEPIDPSDPMSDMHEVPALDNYWVDVIATNVTPDYILPEYPPMPLSYSIHGSNRYLIYASTHDGDVVAGVEFYVDSPCWLHAYQYPRQDPNRQFHNVIAGVYTLTNDGTPSPLPGTFGTMRPTGTFWQRAYLKPAVQLFPGVRYKLVMQFRRAFPGGPFGAVNMPGHEETIVRGPLRIPADNDAIGETTCTFEQDIGSFVFPQTPLKLGSWPYDYMGISSFCMDPIVSVEDPYAKTEVERSLHQKKRPHSMRMQALSAEDSGNGYYWFDGVTGGLEFQVMGDACYATEIRYWRNGWPSQTLIQNAAIYEITTPATAQPIRVGNSPVFQDGSAGTVVPGTEVTFAGWPRDPVGSTEVFAEGWVTARLPLPIKLDKGKSYRVGAFFPNPAQVDATVPVTNEFWEGGPGGAGQSDGPLVAPSRQQSAGRSQSTGAYTYGFDHLEYPKEFVPGNAAAYWVDVGIIDTAPRFVDGPTVVKVIGVNGRERRGTGIDASYIATPLLGVSGTATGLREVDGGVATVALEVHPTAYGGHELIQYTLDARGEGLPLSKHVDGGTTTYDNLGIQVKFTRSRKAAGDDVVAELDISSSSYESFRWAPIPRPALENPFTFRPQDLRFIAQNIMTRQFLHMDLPIVNPTLTWRLSGPFELTGTLAPPYHDILDIMMDEWATFIHVEYQGYIMATGILMPWSATPNELSIEAVGFTTYPHGIPYMEMYSVFFPDVMEVVRELWRHVQSFPNSNMNILLPEGYMGVPLFGKIHHDPQTGKLLGWEAFTLHWTDFEDVGSLIDKLAASTPFDYMEVNGWNSTHTDILHGVNFGYPRLGGKLHNLRFMEGENVVEAIGITAPEDAYASDVIVKGAGEGVDQIYMWVGALIWDRLRRVYILTDEQIQSAEVAYGIANQEILRRLYARGVSEIVVEAFHLNAPFGSYHVGDDILIEGMLPWVGEYILWHRITSIEFSPETGLIKLEVARSESFRYGRPREVGGGKK